MNGIFGRPAGLYGAAAVLLVWAAVLFGFRAPLPLLEPEEARYAEIPRQMLTNDRLLIPLRNGQDYLDKPPLLYWLVMASYHVFGISDWSARIPVIVSAWLTIVVVLIWGWRISGPAVGLAGAAVLALAGDFVYRAPMLTMNGPLALLTTLSLAAGHIALSRFGERFPAIGWWTLSAVACGLGVMMKGPVAIVLTFVPMAAMPWLDRRLVRPGFWAWLLWGIVVMAIAAPWHIAVAIERPGFVEYFFWRHHVERFTAPFDHSGPVWDYLPQVTLGLLPWTLLAGFLAIRRWRSKADDRPLPSTVTIPLIAGLWGFVFFSLAGSKRPVYLVPVIPPLAVAAGAFFVSARLRSRTWIAIGGGTAAVIGVLATVGMVRYSEQFSVREPVRASLVAVPETDCPVICYGREWDSVGFYRQCDDFVSLLGDRRAELGDRLAKNGRTLVFVARRGWMDPTDVDFGSAIVNEIASNGRVRVFLVEK